MNPGFLNVFAVGGVAIASVLISFGLWHKVNVDETCFEPSQRLTNKLIVAGSIFGIAFGILKIMCLNF